MEFRGDKIDLNDWVANSRDDKDKYLMIHTSVFIPCAFLSFFMTRRSNYQNYQKLSYMIAGSIVFSFLMCLTIPIWGIWIKDWANDPEY